MGFDDTPISVDIVVLLYTSAQRISARRLRYQRICLACLLLSLRGVWDVVLRIFIFDLTWLFVQMSSYSFQSFHCRFSSRDAMRLCSMYLR